MIPPISFESLPLSSSSLSIFHSFHSHQHIRSSHRLRRQTCTLKWIQYQLYTQQFKNVNKSINIKHILIPDKIFTTLSFITTSYYLKRKTNKYSFSTKYYFSISTMNNIPQVKIQDLGKTVLYGINTYKPSDLTYKIISGHHFNSSMNILLPHYSSNSPVNYNHNIREIMYILKNSHDDFQHCLELLITKRKRTFQR